MKWGKVPVKAELNGAVTALATPIVVIDELQYDLCQHQK